MNKFEEFLSRCTNVVPGHGPQQPMKEIFQVLADGLKGDEYPDRYGEGEYINEVERLLG